MYVDKTVSVDLRWYDYPVRFRIFPPITKKYTYLKFPARVGSDQKRNQI